MRSLHGARDGSTSLPDEGIVGEVNVYMVVFREGICSVGSLFNDTEYIHNIYGFLVPFCRRWGYIFSS